MVKILPLGASRRAVVQVTHHAHRRVAFGKRLIEQPLMKNVLADLVIESEAATARFFSIGKGLIFPTVYCTTTHAVVLISVMDMPKGATIRIKPHY